MLTLDVIVWLYHWVLFGISIGIIFVFIFFFLFAFIEQDSQKWVRT